MLHLQKMLIFLKTCGDPEQRLYAGLGGITL